MGQSVQGDGGTLQASLLQVYWGTNFVWSELEEVILHIEITLDNRPLTYLDDVTHPDTTCYDVWSTQSVAEDNPDAIESKDLRKRARYLRHCKDVMWTRWTEEYIRSL